MLHSSRGLSLGVELFTITFQKLKAAQPGLKYCKIKKNKNKKDAGAQKNRCGLGALGSDLFLVIWHH